MFQTGSFSFKVYGPQSRRVEKRRRGAQRARRGGRTHSTRGHSYGGMVIKNAPSGHENVNHLVYVTSVMPNRDETLASLDRSREPGLWMDPRPEDGTMRQGRARREYARRAGSVVELPTGHHPMLSRPELLARVLAEAAVTPEA